MQADFAEYERKDVKHRENLKHAKTKAAKLEKSIEKDSHTLSGMSAVTSNLQQDIARHETEIAEAKKTLGKEEEKLEEIYASLKVIILITKRGKVRKEKTERGDCRTSEFLNFAMYCSASFFNFSFFFPFQGETQDLQSQLEEKQIAMLPFSKVVNEKQANVNICLAEIELVTSNARALEVNGNNHLNE